MSPKSIPRPGLTQLGLDFLVLDTLGRRHLLTLDAGIGFPPLVQPSILTVRGTRNVGLYHLDWPCRGSSTTTQHDLLFELFTTLRYGHNTDQISHVRSNLFFITVHETCSTPIRRRRPGHHHAQGHGVSTLIIAESWSDDTPHNAHATAGTPTQHPGPGLRRSARRHSPPAPVPTPF